MEPHTFDPNIKPIGKIRIIAPARPDLPEEDLLLDALPAFAPARFDGRCPSPAAVAAKLADAERLDFDLAPEEIPAEWPALREEARPLLRGIGIWRGDLAPASFARGSVAA